VRESAASVLFVHNHPSGDPTPSEEDKAITRQLVDAGKILGIRVLDHVIIGDGRCTSLAELGVI
jgi:DNA repair protein RadC